MISPLNRYPSVFPFDYSFLWERSGTVGCKESNQMISCSDKMSYIFINKLDKKKILITVKRRLCLIYFCFMSLGILELYAIELGNVLLCTTKFIETSLLISHNIDFFRERIGSVV